MGIYQFLGYWGYASEREEALLTNLETLHVTSLQKNTTWNIAYIGHDSVLPIQPNGSKQIAAISVSGLLTPDAWVNVETRNTKSLLILGREPFGRVPLYWTQLGQVIWFASRLQLLLPILEKPEVSIPGLYGYSCFSYVPTPLTPVDGIYTVPAGTELTWHIDDGKLSTPQSRKLFQWREATEQLKDETTAVAQLQNLLKDAIESQIADLTEQPVGVLLSGGLDSAVVAALLVKAGVKVRAYTLDFDSGISEYPYAEQVASFLKIPLVKVKVTPRHIYKALIPTVQALDMPFGDGVTVPLFLLAQAASLETQVIFNGEGGDQLFAGWTNKPLIAAGVYQCEHPGQESFMQQYLRTFHRLWGLEAQVYQQEVYAQIQNLHPQDWLQEALDYSNTSILHRLRRASLMLKGAQNIHPRATSLGFAHRLRVRSPFCDLSMTDWTFQLSGELCLQAACEKYILKKAVENWLPEEIVWRQKRGMGVPLTSWCLNEFWHQLGFWLNPSILRAENRFSPHLAAQIVSGKLGGTISGRRIGEILWLLIMWQLWRIQVLGEELGTPSWNYPFCLPNWLWKNYRQWQP
ncbi:asparagine synthetase B family protein [Iningainema tapete]|uniref:asparagine synthase (glutamine-hydrolyzing) n=1 Tax=Iningainema tapete BLCC-T55 TaxID=2748662 RepID=A0A8J6XHJ4_9CYAN|nr:asparagine synthetase B family protein [Iningainema tapete]MBD2776945.1 asparagine synthase [Iningainema tapete BLCC-T55]